MTGRRRRWAYLPVPLGLLAGLLLAAPPAHADPAVSVSGLEQEPGLVEFTLVASGLPAGERVDPASVSVQAGDVELPVQEVVELASTSEREEVGRRLAVLVIDVSDSMFGQPIIDALDAASQYVADLPADVEVAIVTVGTTAEVRLPPTSDRGETQALLNGLGTAGDTALYDGLLAAADLAGSEAYTERRVLVLSDGADSTSTTGLEAAQQGLVEVGVPVDTVAYRTQQTVADLLAGFSRTTDGEAYLAEDATDLAGAFRRAAGAFTVRLLITAEVPAELSGADTSLDISVRVGEQSLSTAVPVLLAGSSDAAGGLIRVPASRLTPLAEAGLLALIFAGILALALVVIAPLLDRRHRRRVTARLDHFSVAPPAPPPAVSEEGNPVARAALALSERMVQRPGVESKMTLKLDRAGMRLRPHEWLLLRALACLVTMLMLALFLGPLGGILLGLLIGWAGTELYQRRRADRRVQSFADHFPDALQLMIGSLRSGFSLPQAVDAMVREFPDPISSEFGRALGEARLGGRLEDALERVAQRMQNADLSWAVVAIRVQQQVGGNLAEVLSTTVRTIRERNALRRQVRALSAEGRLSAWILIALPVAVGAFMFLFRSEYARSLYTHPLGIVMLIVGVLLLVVGAFWMSRVVKVEV